MLEYQNVVVALDIYSEYEMVLERALKIADTSKHLHLVHVTLPQVYFEPYGAAFNSDFVTDIREQAKTRLNSIAEKYHIQADQVHALLGDPAAEIHKVAEEVKADLIVIGTHGQSGLKLLLGSTANGVLHGVKCDVLAVKV
jgi:universal stress protein A